MPFSTYLCKKNIFFYPELRGLGPFYFVSSTGNLGPPRAKSLENGGLSFLPSQRKIEPVSHIVVS